MFYSCSSGWLFFRQVRVEQNKQWTWWRGIKQSWTWSTVIQTTCMNESCLAFIESWHIWLVPWDSSDMRHDSFIRETWLIHTWDMLVQNADDLIPLENGADFHSYARHDSFIRETWLIQTWDMTHTKHRWFDHRGKWRRFLFVCMTCSYTCVRVYDLQWHSFPFVCVSCVPWLVHMWDMTRTKHRWFNHFGKWCGSVAFCKTGQCMCTTKRPHTNEKWRVFMKSDTHLWN